jgi:Tannase and feruloyl esterase
MRFILAIVASLAFGRSSGAQEDRVSRSAAADCAKLTALVLDNVRITSAVAVQPTAAQRADGRGPVCRVNGVIDTETQFQALLPDNWNQRLMMGGGGGFDGTISNDAAASATQGFATVGTDGGHHADALHAGWALHNETRQIAFAYLAVHRTAEVTKQIIRAYYGSAPVRSYFRGCSNGGREALVEAERYPDDFDGIVAIAPVVDFGAIAMTFVRNLQAQFPSGDFAAPIVTPANAALLESKMLEACDAGDGVRDGVLNDPSGCHFDVSSLPVCANDAASVDCVTRAQRAAIATLLSPVLLDGAVVYPALPPGNVGLPASWPRWVIGGDSSAAGLLGPSFPSAQAGFGTEFFKYFVFGDSTWSFARYDLRKAPVDTRRVGQLLSAASTDLSAFARHGGKLILAHGWSDPALNPNATIQYYDAVRARSASMADSAVRLYMLPGVLHCVGGPGCDVVDWDRAIVEWVEHGTAPGRIVAGKRGPAPAPGAARAIARTRPLCPYPERATYSGSGSTDEEKNFVCR